jgi:hypothetical protein
MAELVGSSLAQPARSKAANTISLIFISVDDVQVPITDVTLNPGEEVNDLNDLLAGFFDHPIFDVLRHGKNNVPMLQTAVVGRRHGLGVSERGCAHAAAFNVVPVPTARSIAGTEAVEVFRNRFVVITPQRRELLTGRLWRLQLR